MRIPSWLSRYFPQAPRERADARAHGSYAHFIDQEYGNKDGWLTPDEVARFACDLGNNWAWHGVIQEIAAWFRVPVVSTPEGLRLVIAGVIATQAPLRGDVHPKPLAPATPLDPSQRAPGFVLKRPAGGG
jgi:hypothetical protein